MFFNRIGYKANFAALEIYRNGTWSDIGDPDGYDAALHPLSTAPIAEQVARINLPNGASVVR